MVTIALAVLLGPREWTPSTGILPAPAAFSGPAQDAETWLREMSGTLQQEKERTLLTVSARAELPDGAVVRAAAYPVRERFDEGSGRVAPSTDGSVPRFLRVTVEKRSLRAEWRLGKAGTYRIEFAFDPAEQSAEVRGRARARLEHSQVVSFGDIRARCRALHKDMDEAQGWIDEAASALDRHAADAAGLSVELNALRIDRLASRFEETSAEATAERLIGAIVRQILADRLGRPAADAEPSGANAGFAEELELCRQLMRREYALWHLKLMRPLLMELPAAAAKEDPPDLGTRFREDLEAVRGGFERIAEPYELESIERGYVKRISGILEAIGELAEDVADAREKEIPREPIVERIQRQLEAMDELERVTRRPARPESKRDD